MNILMPISAKTAEDAAAEVSNTHYKNENKTDNAADNAFGIMLAAMSTTGVLRRVGNLDGQVEKNIKNENKGVEAVDTIQSAEYAEESESIAGLLGQGNDNTGKKISGASAFKYFLNPEAGTGWEDVSSQDILQVNNDKASDMSMSKIETPFSNKVNGMRILHTQSEAAERLTQSFSDVTADIELGGMAVNLQKGHPLSNNPVRPAFDARNGQEKPSKVIAGASDIQTGQKISQDIDDFITTVDTDNRRQEQPMFQTIKFPSKEQVSFETEQGKNTDTVYSESALQGRTNEPGSPAAAAIAGHSDERADRYQENMMPDKAGKGQVQAAMQMADATSNIRTAGPKASVAESAVFVLDPNKNVDIPRFLITHHDSRSIEVSLHPEGLGKLDIGLVLDRGIMHAQIQASHPAGKELVERNIHELINALNKDGIMIGGFSVSLKDNSSEWGGNNEFYSERPQGQGYDDTESLSSSSIARDDSIVSIFV